MKIIHTPSGLPYQLKPGTQIEVERTNLFFNEYGEQTVPVELPDTDRNRELTGYTDMLSNMKKPSTSIPVTIQDGNYFMPCRQAILGAQRKTGISTSFYMNEGSFLSRISDTSLSDIFGDETIPGITTVQQGIDFCRSLVSGTNPDFAIFPVLLNSEATYSNGYPIYKYINRFGYTNSEDIFLDGVNGKITPDFFNASLRTEKVGEETITLNPGYYISPFIRANYLLKRIFSHFGYTLTNNFFTHTHPFPDMVFINNCADSLVNGTIRLVDLIPDCMCSTILEVFRKKFCCEFFPNEIDRTVHITLFNEVANTDTDTDLTPYLTSMPKIESPESYQQLIISSEEQVSDTESVETVDSMAILMNKYGAVELDFYLGYFYRLGYRSTYLAGENYATNIYDKVANSGMRYYAGGNLKTKEITVPDKHPEFRKVYRGQWMVDRDGHEADLLYIGAANFLNSKIISSSSEGKDEDSSSNNPTLKPMLAFYYNNANYPCGTICNYIMKGTVGSSGLIGTRYSDYTLCYNGTDGIFERFYRIYDDVHRNSLYDVSASFLLPDALKQSLPAHLPVLLCGQKLFLNTFNYLIGGNTEPIETKLLTYRLYEPISSAKKFSDYYPPYVDGSPVYGWYYHYFNSEISAEQYQSSPYKGKQLDIMFPPFPSAELAIPEKKYCTQFRAYNNGNGHYYQESCWLECSKIDWSGWPE